MDDERDAEIIRQAVVFVAKYEGCLLHAYPDPASALGMAIGNKGIQAIGNGGDIPILYKHLNGDPWTVGYGQVGPHVKFGVEWNEQMATAALHLECMQRWSAIKRLVSAPLAIPQAVALIGFVYNLGIGAFTTSTLRRRINGGNYTAAALEFDKWTHAGGREMKGLVTRRAAERALFESALVLVCEPTNELKT